MSKLKLSAGFILLFSIFIHSQSYINDDIHPYSRSLFGSLNGGITIGKTDYKNTSLGVAGLLSASYFFPAADENALGIRLSLGMSNIKGKDENKLSLAEDGTIITPDKFSTDAFSISPSVLYSYAVTKQFLPYAGVGLSYYFFNPKNENGELLNNNRNNIYDKKTLGFDAELGISIPVNGQLSIEVNSALHYLFTDYFDDLAVGKNKDFFAAVSLGVSYAFVNNRDSDGDGITDVDDHCPDEPEDYDGFQDEDGCPDYDNDGDGIPDTKDICPNEAEDYDGYKDADGCPDLDNDGDGILDKDDKCPNEAEDFDGFQDDDGCPDLDNDNDGIPDKDDKCPNQAETINGYQDDDGCPDTPPATQEKSGIETIKAGDTFVLSGDDLFFENRAEIKPEAYKKLDDVVAQLKQDPKSYWRIEGHMDSGGPEQWVRTMSSKRAEAVYYYFVSHGLDAARFTIYGLGDKFPIANNTTEQGRAKNRRIVLVKEHQ
jgi:outer membrane protein OmpA-like peptidoglycan-associated protein/opacity protein-like surface antigen